MRIYYSLEEVCEFEIEEHMEINKQLFEDVLSGKLKGTFVLRNGQKENSFSLERNTEGLLSIFPYALSSDSYYHTYTERGTYYSSPRDYGYHYGEQKPGPCEYDIVDFIPDTDMKENELKITIPEGQEIDWQESAKQEKIVFKKKDAKPRSWEEYCKQHKGSYYFISSEAGVNIVGCKYSSNELVALDPKMSKHTLPTEELAEAFLAMMQLMSLRQAWVGDWQPDWSNFDEDKWCVVNHTNAPIVGIFGNASRPFSFPTKEMAEDFMNTFKDLLKIARPLI